MLLEEGLTSQGATSRSYDKYGKRMWTATPTKDMSHKDASMSAPSGVNVPAVSSDTKRSDVGIK